MRQLEHRVNRALAHHKKTLTVVDLGIIVKYAHGHERGQKDRSSNANHNDDRKNLTSKCENWLADYGSN